MTATPAAPGSLAAEPNGLRARIAELAADWAAPADRPSTLTRDEIVEQHVYGECAKSLRELLNVAGIADTTPAAPGTAGGAQEAVHACPPDGEQVTPCCGETPFDLPRTDRMTNDPSLVTCGGAQEAATPGQAIAAELEVLAGQHEQNALQSRRNSTVESFHRGVAAGLDNAAGRLHHQLAPAWDALAAERDAARTELATCRERNAAIAVQLDQYRDEGDRYRKALEHARHVLEEHDEPDDDARGRALAIICAALEARDA